MSNESEIYVVIKPRNRLGIQELRELWQFRELTFYLIWRDVIVRYKQTILGFSWAFINPFLNMVLFSVIFGGLAQLDSEGVPYPIFNYAALLPWMFFSSGIIRASSSLTGNSNLIKKVYFPRIILPITSVIGGVPDFLLSLLVMLALMSFYGLPIYLLKILLIVPLLFLASLTAIGLGFWFSALNVRYRDVSYIVNYAVRFLMYATPVVYSLNEVRSRLDDVLFQLYSLNPMVGVIEMFRWIFLDRPAPDAMIILSMIIVPIVLFLTGAVYFHSQEHHFADFA